jgi:plasmid stabilization system protein ParE
MSKQVIWSPLSEGDFARILEYLNKNWDSTVVTQFIDLTEKNLEQISCNPKQFLLIYNKEKIRKCVLTKHNSLYYRENKTNVDILRIFDTRQDPNTFTFK